MESLKSTPETRQALKRNFGREFCDNLFNISLQKKRKEKKGNFWWLEFLIP